MSQMKAIVFKSDTTMLLAAQQASEKKFNLYLTRNGTFVAAAKRLNPDWISIGVKIK